MSSLIYTGGWRFFVLGGVILALLNMLVKPLLKILALPLIFMSGGLFVIVINVMIFAFTKYAINTIDILSITMQFDGIINMVFAGVMFGLVNWLGHLFVKA
jgi:putative membrane protein